MKSDSGTCEDINECLFGKTQYVKIIKALINVHVLMDIVVNVKTSTNVRTSILVQIGTQYVITMMAVSRVLVLLVTAMSMVFMMMSTNVSSLTVAMTTQDAHAVGLCQKR